MAEQPRKKYVVTAPLVMCKTVSPEHGPVILNFYAGAPVPADAEEEWVKNHLESKMIAEVEDPLQVDYNALHPDPVTVREMMHEGKSVVAETNDRVVAAEKRRGPRGGQAPQRQHEPQKQEGGQEAKPPVTPVAAPKPPAK
jgi:hypothetical protein